MGDVLLSPQFSQARTLQSVSTLAFCKYVVGKDSPYVGTRVLTCVPIYGLTYVSTLALCKYVVCKCVVSISIPAFCECVASNADMGGVLLCLYMCSKYLYTGFL